MSQVLLVYCVHLFIVYCFICANEVACVAGGFLLVGGKAGPKRMVQLRGKWGESRDSHGKAVFRCSRPIFPQLRHLFWPGFPASPPTKDHQLRRLLMKLNVNNDIICLPWKGN